MPSASSQRARARTGKRCRAASRVTKGGGDAAEPVARVCSGAVVKGEAGLDQAAGEIVGQWRERVRASHTIAVGIGQPGDSIGKFGALGEGAQWAEIGRTEISRAKAGS